MLNYKVRIIRSILQRPYEILEVKDVNTSNTVLYVDVF